MSPIAARRLAALLAAAPRPLRRFAARRMDPAAARWLQGLEGADRPYSLDGMRRRGCLFVHVPKCAGLAMAETLFGDKAGAHASLEDYLYHFGARWTDRAFKFAFVRDPVSRTVSAFEFLRAGGLHRWDAAFAERHLARFADVEAFARDGLSDPAILRYPHFREQVSFLTDPRTGRVGVDFVGRYERIGEDFARVCARLGVEAPLAERNRRPMAKAAPDLSDAAAARIRQVYRRDCEAFGYAPAPPRPQTQAERAALTT
ncbi:sulfotransferase family 2 domain-containing protein [Albimonas pacifica]|uniref:Sulfotransferase family protein n=1 Tax=Albimonas pacifica TaxID=1114924 RepID=A0A1I3IKS9_9RHOB|nr:sulfotransferase family 2 domain-containing protein [Albimonas pacifica]SFI48437.1 Sulfotransferase family protein [Albimonas pacifica]